MKEVYVVKVEGSLRHLMTKEDYWAVERCENMGFLTIESVDIFSDRESLARHMQATAGSGPGTIPGS